MEDLELSDEIGSVLDVVSLIRLWWVDHKFFRSSVSFVVEVFVPFTIALKGT